MPFTIPSYDVWPIVIPDATDTTDGLMSAADKLKLDSLQTETSVLVPIDGLVPAPTNSGAPTDISTVGSATLSHLVPAGATGFRVRQSGPILTGAPVGDTANLATGGMVVFHGATVLVPDATGLYTVVPGWTLTIIAGIINIFNSSPQTAPVNLWSVEFTFGFSS